ncbi:carboxymuconolactone decarboxylase family protein [Gordonia neofelifaecis]|uniref:Alkylhydroperoxidase like protein, AhpD family n=1 Tax=Gordonia neofelifaecis NRRL B-59395 TaxID=644548 RepID=F1YLD8_9ACTN|nr:carboxymuconolactone decarboxylase family protein [Gordonia neofelifaecis]EGD54598.1 alkylhydroperoxidase like protein, AhpD family [Gordonia neofelifaecis NRRL B-59395]
MTMNARMTNPVMLLPGVFDALMAIHKTVADTGLPQDLCEMVNMRASQLNGCSTCLDGHWRIARKLGVSDEKLFAVGAWRDSPYFSDAERIALEMAEELTELSNKPEAVSDELWERAADEFDEAQLAALVVAIGNINLYNRVNHATRQVGGSWKP